MNIRLFGENGHVLEGNIVETTNLCLILSNVVITDELGIVEKYQIMNIKLRDLDEKWYLVQ